MPVARKSSLMGQTTEPSLLRKGIGHLGAALFFRVSLCASRDIFPDYAELSPDGIMVTPRLQSPEASWIVPHIAFASPALLHGVSANGKPFVKMPPPKDVAGAFVPVCSSTKLCELQRVALALPRCSFLPRPAQPAQAMPFPAQAVPPLPFGAL